MAAAAAGVQYSIAGPDLGEARPGAPAALLGTMKSLPDLADADTSLVIGKPELRVEIDRQRAADLGVRVQDIAQALNVLIGGENVTTFNVGNNQYDVTLRASEPFRADLDGLRRLTVFFEPARRGPLGEIVRIVPGTGPSSIRAAEPPAAGHAERASRARRVPGAADVADRAGGHRPAAAGGLSAACRRRSRNWHGRPDTSSSRSRCRSSSCTSCSPRSSSRSSIRSRFC